MTTDQPTRCSEQWRYIDGTFGERCALPPHPPGTLHEADFGDGTRQWQTEAAHPTPPSSLEEARREVQATQQHARECALMKDAKALDCTCYSWLILTLYGEIAKAAARAEVIREVEAAIRGKLGVTSRALTVVRALSQGGEGKA